MSSLLAHAFSTVAGLVFVFAPFAWCRWRGESPDAYGLTWNFDRRSLVECAAVTALVLIPLTYISISWPLEDLPRRSDLWRTLSIGASGLGAAVIEEIFFRGWIYPLLRKKLPALVSIVITSAVFAAAHIFVARTLFLAAVFFPGCVMAALRERHGSIATSTIFHGTCNIWAIWFAPLVWPTLPELGDFVRRLF